MGGKSKQAQRTKNNARPSSSGRSAELLGTFGSGTVAGTALFPSLAAAAAPDAALAPDLALCIKKLNKKDPITKTKALQELSELVQNSEVDDVVAMLPNWTYFYKALTVDPDRRVRELTQVCHGSIVGACGRRVAPQLKALLPSWLAAQHDEHAPARARAQLTLHSTFPENKLPEAISFCKAEVLALMIDNLLDSNAAISRKLDSEEERAQAAVRVLVGALGGLRYLAQGLPRAHDDWLWAELAPLLQAAAFWRLAAHTAPEVRAAWYGAAGALGSRFGAAWGAAHGARALRLLLQAREGGAAAHALWSALLLLLAADPEWHSRLDKMELLSKRVLEVVSAGGWGSARALADTLPALLALLPPRTLAPAFCAELFDAYFAGLEKRSIRGSKSERSAWIAGIGECVRVLAERADLPPEVAPCALGCWLRAVLGCSALGVRAALVHSLQPMLSGWARIQRLELLVRGFWQSVACTVAKQLKDLGTPVDQTQLAALLDAHACFLLTLHEALHQKPKKRKGVTFADDAEPNTEDKSDDATEDGTDTDKEEATLLLRHQLDECAQRVGAAYMELARDCACVQCVLRGLVPVLGALGARGVWAALGSALQGSGSAGSPFSLWERGLRPWLAAEATRCEAAVDVTFLLLPHLTEEEQDAVFASFETLDAVAADWALARSVRSGAEHARSWLRAPAARAACLRAARAALAGDGAARDTLLACLAPGNDGAIPAGEETASEVLQVVAYVVRAGGGRGAAVALAGRLAALLQGRAPDLLAALLAHELAHAGSEGEWERESETRAAWRAGVRALPPAQRRALVPALVALVRDRLPTHCNELEPERIVQCAGAGAQLAAACGDGAAVAELLLAHDDGNVALVHALRHDIVAGRLNCPFEDDELVCAATSDTSEWSVAGFLPFARACILRAAFLRALSEHEPSCLAAPPLAAAHAQLLHDHAVVRSLKDGYAFCVGYDVICATDAQLSALIDGIARLTPEPLAAGARAALAVRAQASGYYWARAAALYGALSTTAQCDHNLTGNGFFHGLQAVMELAKSEESQECEEQPQPPSRLYTAHALMCRALQAAHAHADPELARAAGADGAGGADVVVDAYYRREATMLYDTDISAAAWREAACAASVADYLAELLAAAGWDAPAHHWDFATISLSSLLASLDCSRHAWGSIKVAMVSRAVLRLLRVVTRFVRGVARAAERRPASAHVAALPREWADVFAPSAAHHLHALLLHVLEEVETEGGGTMSVCRARVLSGLCAATRCVSWAQLPAASRAQLSVQRAARAAAAALAGRAHHAHKYLAHYTLRALSEHIVLEDAERLRAWSAGSGGEGGEESAPAPAPRLVLHELDERLAQLQQLVDAALAHLRVGSETCSTAPGSDTHSLALGWLLLAAALGALADLQRGELALHCAERVRARRLAEQLLPAALRLLPAHVAQYATEPASGAQPPRDAADMFLAVKEFSVDEPSLGADVAALACRALFVGVAGCGGGAGGARGWWSAAPAKAARALSRLVRAYVAPSLVRAQLRAVAERGAGDLPDTEVAVHWSSGEVTCCVYVEERRVELSVCLSAEHPLALPRVTAPPPHPHSPAPNTHWLAVYLAYQNGSLLSALRMWVGAVSARVEAAPQCYICYCRLHPASGRLPSVPCHQCRNKFHPHCLRKWFTSSNKSNCPLCRAAF